MIKGANGCPNPVCYGGAESLRVKVDGKCSGGYFGWVRCTLCGVSGPTMRSEQDAVDIWNKMTSGIAKAVTVDMAAASRLLMEDCKVDCPEGYDGEICKDHGPCLKRNAISLLGNCIDRVIENGKFSTAKRLDDEAKVRLSKDVKYDHKSIEYVSGGATKGGTTV